MEASEYDSLIEQRLEADEMCAALHEAGHAMLADALDVGIECASIKELRNPNAKPPAYVRSGPCPVKFEVVIVLAGQAVDESLGADASCQRNPMMYETDEKRLEECRTKLFPDQKKETQGFFHYNQTLPKIRTDWVLKWVRENAEAIGRFAKHLKEKKELQGTELRECLDNAWADQKPDFVVRAEVGEQISRLTLPSEGP